MKINLVSSPRNRSTLLMYSFAQRSDTQVSDEPYYAHYLKWSATDHPGREEILQKQSSEIDIAHKQLNAIVSPVLFIKNMAHHYRTEDFKYLLDFKNVLYIRNPRAIIRSYSKVIEKPVSNDIGINQVKRIYDFLKKNGKEPIILDSDDLISNPESVLSDLCYKLKIPFNKAMLRWRAGPKSYDGIWAKYWYSTVHKSTEFIVQKNIAGENINLNPELEQLAQTCMPSYLELKQHSIQVK